MQLTIRLLGTEVLHISTEPDAEYQDDAVADQQLSGGNLGSMVIEAGPTDRYMGFTNGMGDDEP